MRTIHIFDMDDALLVTPTFADMMDTGNAQLDEFLESLKKAFLLFMAKEIGFERRGSFIVLMDVAKKAPLPSYYLTVVSERLEEMGNIDPERFKEQNGISRSSLKDMLKALKDKDGLSIVAQVRGFHSDPNTIGSIVNPELESTYRSVENKMVLTGRGNGMAEAITKRFKEIGLPFPNYGLYCYPSNDNSGISNFKAKTILASINQHRWESVHFYEDRGDWLEMAREAVMKTYPHVVFVPHHIRNVHDGRSL